MTQPAGDLLVIVPSRGRPKNIARLLDSVHETSMAATHLHVAVDEDDPHLDGYQAVMSHAGGDGDILEVGPRKGLTGWTNEVACRRAAEYPYLASFGDDMVPRTPGWDRALIRGIQDMGGTGITYPFDGTREDVPEACVLSSDIVTALGWMAFPGCEHFYIDDVWADLGRGAGCIRHLRAILVEHVKQSDKTAQDANEKIAPDREAYYAWRRSGRMAEDIKTVASLRALQPA